jgi:hypothetical protein
MRLAVGAADLRELRADRVRVVALVAEEAPGRGARNQRRSSLIVVALPFGNLIRGRQSERVDDQVHLRRQAAARAPDGLPLGPPFPPAEC